MKIPFVFLIIIHGLIHFMGFGKAFNLAPVSQLTLDVSKVNGLLWLTTGLLFLLSAIVLLMGREWWWVTCLGAGLLSQFLIFGAWRDAKAGTVMNVVILLVAVIGYSSWHFEHRYKQKVAANLSGLIGDSLLVETDLATLPLPVQKYLRYTGCVNSPKVKNFRVEFKGQIRKNEQSDWMPFTSVQYNFIDQSARLFFMKAVMKHLPVAGFHCFRNGVAFMDIRLLSLFKVQYQDGREMNEAETVTFFNDMCCMAPASLIDHRIKWLETDGNKVRASFTNNNITIVAWLYFNEIGELINFVSGNRWAAGDNNVMRQLPWSTPIKNYRAFNGHKVGSYADAVYSYPEGDLCYGNFTTMDLTYNCKSLN